MLRYAPARSRDFDVSDSSLSQCQLLCPLMALSNFCNFFLDGFTSIGSRNVWAPKTYPFQDTDVQCRRQRPCVWFDIIWWPLLAFWFWLWIFEARWQDRAKKRQERIRNITCYTANCEFLSLIVSGTLSNQGQGNIDTATRSLSLLPASYSFVWLKALETLRVVGTSVMFCDCCRLLVPLFNFFTPLHC